MDQDRFEQMVARLEIESAQNPSTYQVKVGLLALLGFCVLGLIIGIAGFGLLLVVGLVLALFAYGGSAAILLVKFGKALFVLAIPLWFLVKASFSALFTKVPRPQGKELFRKQAPALFTAIDQMRQQMKGPQFHHVLITNDMNAAVMQRPAFGIFGWPRNYLILGLPMLESLSAEEALAVVAHEYGHLAGSHSKFGAYIYRLRNTWATLSAIAEYWQGWTGKLLQKVVGWYAPYFNAYTFVLARANEYQADTAAAELVGAQTAANALKRVNVSAAHQTHFYEKTFELVADQSTPPSNIAEQWAHTALNPVPNELSQTWLNQALSRTSTVADTHPALTQRLQALMVEADDLEVVPAPPSGRSAATAWLGQHLTTLRNEMQSEWASGVAEPWRDRHAQIQEQRKRLGQLEALKAPTVDEQCERLQLRLQLDKQADHLPALLEFNTTNQNHALGLFLEAGWRLDHGDEDGLTLMDRVMAVDANAIKVACETAWNYLTKRGNAERAQHYHTLWTERQKWETERNEQLSNLELTHVLQPAIELSEEERRIVHTNIHKNRQGIKRAYIARRIIPLDPNQLTYVVAIELTVWATLRKKGPEITRSLLAMEWPAHTFICTMTHELKALKSRISVVQNTTIPL